MQATHIACQKCYFIGNLGHLRHKIPLLMIFNGEIAWPALSRRRAALVGLSRSEGVTGAQLLTLHTYWQLGCTGLLKGHLLALLNKAEAVAEGLERQPGQKLRLCRCRIHVQTQFDANLRSINYACQAGEKGGGRGGVGVGVEQSVSSKQRA